MMDKDGISLRAVEPIIWRDEKQRFEVCGSVRFLGQSLVPR